MLSALNYYNRRVALEAGLVQDLQGLIRNVFPDIKAELTGFFQRFMPDEKGIALTSRQNDFLREITKHPYLDIAPLGAFVPEGLNVNYLDYLEVLTPAVIHAVGEHAKEGELSGGVGAINDYVSYLGALINIHDHQRSTKDFEREVKVREAERTTLNKELGKCFKLGSTRTDVSVGQVVSRNNDWEKVFHQSDALVKAVNSVDRKVLNKKIAECTSLLDIIQKKIERQEFDTVSPETVKNLAGLAYNMAAELEFYVAIYYKVAALAEAINRTVQHFENVNV